MSNKITDENGNTYVQKKPFYKKPWFWIVVIFLVLIAVASSSSDVHSPKKVNESSKQAKAKTAPENQKMFKIGDTVDLDGIQMTVNSVEYPAGNEYNQAEDGKSWVVVNLSIKNTSGKVVNYNPFDFKLDADGNATTFDGINIDVKNKLNSGELKDGASVSGNLVGEADPAKKLTLEYRGSLFSDDTKFTVKLN